MVEKKDVAAASEGGSPCSTSPDLTRGRRDAMVVTAKRGGRKTGNQGTLVLLLVRQRVWGGGWSPEGGRVVDAMASQ